MGFRRTPQDCSGRGVVHGHGLLLGGRGGHAARRRQHLDVRLPGLPVGGRGGSGCGGGQGQVAARPAGAAAPAGGAGAAGRPGAEPVGRAAVLALVEVPFHVPSESKRKWIKSFVASIMLNEMSREDISIGLIGIGNVFLLLLYCSAWPFRFLLGIIYKLET